jgi:hypothetical protein
MMWRVSTELADVVSDDATEWPILLAGSAPVAQCFPVATSAATAP